MLYVQYLLHIRSRYARHLAIADCIPFINSAAVFALRKKIKFIRLGQTVSNPVKPFFRGFYSFFMQGQFRFDDRLSTLKN